MTSFVVLLLAYTLSQFYRSFLAVVAADLTRDLGLDAAGLGMLSATWFVTFAIAQFPVGYALDRYGPNRTMSLGMLAAVAGAVLLALATGYGTALAAMALIGIGCSPIYMSSLYIVAREQPHRFAVLSALILGLGSVGNLLGATPLVLAAEQFGWRGTFLAIAAATALSALSVRLLVRDPPRIETEHAGDTPLGGIATILSIRILWLLLPLCLVSYAFVIATRSVWIAPYLTSTFALAPEPLGNAVLAMALAMSLGAIASGSVVRFLGAKRVTILGGLAAVACFLLLGTGQKSVPAAVVVLTALGFFGITYAVLMEHARAFFPPHLIGRGMTLVNFAFIGGAGLAQWASGLAVRAWLDGGVAAPLAYERLFLGYALVLAAALAIYAFAPMRPRPATPPAPAP